VTFSTKLLKLTADQLSTIFEPFQQFELSSARGSMGLALPLVRAIILAHGGTCGADLGAAGGIAIGLQIPNLS
jgi:K+-sensing histidine kinase KdpD